MLTAYSGGPIVVYAVARAARVAPRYEPFPRAITDVSAALPDHLGQNHAADSIAGYGTKRRSVRSSKSRPSPVDLFQARTDLRPTRRGNN
ncbi:MAG: hypothetical protein RL077_138 [Verrucomicrobiota bacterium]